MRLIHLHQRRDGLLHYVWEALGSNMAITDEF